jgi:hypothetical protein
LISDWKNQGPANRRHYQCTDSQDQNVINEARKFFQSEAFFLVLSNLTGLKLHRLASTPSSSDAESEPENHRNVSLLFTLVLLFLTDFSYRNPSGIQK